MRGLKDIIARRRPTTLDAHEAGTAADLDADLAADSHERRPEAPTADPRSDVPDADRDAVSAPAAGPAPRQDEDLHKAQQARAHVPRPVSPTIKDQPDWHAARKMAETRLVAPDPESGTPAADADKAAAQPPGTDWSEEEISPAEPPAAAPTDARPKIWDLQQPARGTHGTGAMPPAEAEEPARRTTVPVTRPLTEDAPDPQMRRLGISAPPVAETPPPAPAPRRMSSERVKTRLLGFHTEDVEPDVFAANPVVSGTAAPRFPIGWLVVIDGPGRGASFTLTSGLSTIGRDIDQTVCLDFGDTAISRDRHVAIAFDDEENRAYVGHGGKSNIVRLNGRPLLTTEDLGDGDTIKIGKTVLRYVAFCSPDFSWQSDATDDGDEHG